MASSKPQVQGAAMTDKTRTRLQDQLAAPDVSDDQNPRFLFSTTATDLLLAIAGGLIDPVALAQRELANRGLDQNGQWIGHERARKMWQATSAKEERS